MLNALKKYGGLVADNGGFLSFSVAPDDRFTNNAFAHISSIAVTNLEVVQSTSETGGPRSPGKPSADAGPDLTVPLGQTASLAGVVTWSNLAPAVQWKLYSGPGTVTFGSATNATTTATFNAPGVYTLMLSADDGVHSVAYDAVVATVQPMITLSLTGAGTNLTLQWNGNATPPYLVEKTTNLAPPGWFVWQTNANTNFSLQISADESAAFFRVRTP